MNVVQTPSLPRDSLPAGEASFATAPMGHGALRIAFFLEAFPVVSETFILRQITGLLDLGHEVEIFANARAETNAPLHPEVTTHRLLERTTYIDAPPESSVWEMPVWPLGDRTWAPGASKGTLNFVRVVRALPKLTGCLATAPRLAWQALDASEYGCQAASLSALYRLATLKSAGRRFDVLHAHFGPVANSFRFARALWGAPLVATFHGYDFSVVPREQGARVYERLFDVADAVTVNSDYASRQVIGLGCAPDRIHKHHYGVEVGHFLREDRARQVAEPVCLLTVARLVEKKGIEYALQAVARVRQAHPNLQYHIVGDGPLRAALTKLAGLLGLQEVAVFHGAKDSRFVQQRMAEADVFLLPSVTAADGDQEGTPVSLIEAQATGLPVLSTLHSGIPEVVLDGGSGFLVRERDVEGLADRLLYLIEHPEVCRTMGARGRQHVEEQFDLPKLNQDLVALYRQAIARFGRPGAGRHGTR
jgi:colanic acid/amylovoran/stewartan biosynthesis glycosyltransferase WcaL/AmsK/CpsK